MINGACYDLHFHCFVMQGFFSVSLECQNVSNLKTIVFVFPALEGSPSVIIPLAALCTILLLVCGPNEISMQLARWSKISNHCNRPIQVCNKICKNVYKQMYISKLFKHNSFSWVQLLHNWCWQLVTPCVFSVCFHIKHYCERFHSR